MALYLYGHKEEMKIVHYVLIKKLYIMLNLHFVFALKVNLFKGITLPEAPKFGKVFGGQFLGQVDLESSSFEFCNTVSNKYC